MCHCIKPLLSLVLLGLAFPVFSQEANRLVNKGIIVKTNLLSLVARRPTVSIEKTFRGNLGIEASYVQGQFHNILLTDYYSYNGFLIRAKKYFLDLDYTYPSPFIGIYTGNLFRNIKTEGGSLDNRGWVGYPSRNFSSNSLRGGGTFGISYLTKRKFIIEGLGSIGYGRYINLDKSDPNTYSNGYPDVQVWLSIGYCL